MAKLGLNFKNENRYQKYKMQKTRRPYMNNSININTYKIIVLIQIKEIKCNRCRDE